MTTNVTLVMLVEVAFVTLFEILVEGREDVAWMSDKSHCEVYESINWVRKTSYNNSLNSYRGWDIKWLRNHHIVSVEKLMKKIWFNERYTQRIS